MNNNEVSRKEFDTLVERVAKIEGQVPSVEIKPPTVEKSTSKREHFLQYNLKTGVEKCLVIMSMLDTENIEMGFNLEAIQEMYKTVKEKMPTNLSDVIAQLHRKGFVDIRSGKGRDRMYSLTNTGLEALKELKKKEV